MTFPLPTALRERLQLVREGAAGADPVHRHADLARPGRPFKGFEVFVAGEEPDRGRRHRVSPSIPAPRRGGLRWPSHESRQPRRFDRARFYTIEGQQWPSVTTVLDIIAKPALGPWYAKEERRYFEAAMLEVLTKPGARDPEYVLAAVAEAVTGVKAADRAKQQAATIGTAIHAGIEWAPPQRSWARTPAPSPGCPTPPPGRWRAGRTGRRAWPSSLWPSSARSTGRLWLRGTLDLYARVRGVLTVLDWKSGKAIYPEAFLQNVAYRHAAARLGLPSSQGLIVRLPKLIDDPAWEVMPVPETVTVADFLGPLPVSGAGSGRWTGSPTGDGAVGRRRDLARSLSPIGRDRAHEH